VQDGVGRALGDGERDVARVGQSVAVDERGDPPADLGDRLWHGLEAKIEALDLGGLR
jgi:hypothetical protein